MVSLFSKTFYEIIVNSHKLARHNKVNLCMLYTIFLPKWGKQSSKPLICIITSKILNIASHICFLLAQYLGTNIFNIVTVLLFLIFINWIIQYITFSTQLNFLEIHCVLCVSFLHFTIYIVTYHINICTYICVYSAPNCYKPFERKHLVS